MAWATVDAVSSSRGSGRLRPATGSLLLPRSPTLAGCNCAVAASGGGLLTFICANEGVMPAFAWGVGTCWGVTACACRLETLRPGIPLPGGLLSPGMPPLGRGNEPKGVLPAPPLTPLTMERGNIPGCGKPSGQLPGAAPRLEATACRMSGVIPLPYPRVDMIEVGSWGKPLPGCPITHVFARLNRMAF